jgi:hypothetical protein
LDTFAKTKVSSLAGDRGVAKKKILPFKDLKPKKPRENSRDTPRENQ